MTTLFWNETPVALKLSQRKTIALHVDKGQIELRAPKHVDLDFAQSFLMSKDRWLRKTLAKQQALTLDKIDYSRANSAPFMGLNIHLNREEKPGPIQWLLEDQGLRMLAPDFEEEGIVAAILASFYKTQARFWLTKKTQEIAEKADLIDKLSDVRFRKTKSKWGHCTATGRIQYNWQIMMAPEPVIDYLVSHEVSHLKYLDHSPAFWNLVETLHPNYEADRTWLRQHEHRLTLD